MIRQRVTVGDGSPLVFASISIRPVDPVAPIEAWIEWFDELKRLVPTN